MELSGRLTQSKKTDNKILTPKPNYEHLLTQYHDAMHEGHYLRASSLAKKLQPVATSPTLLFESERARRIRRDNLEELLRAYSKKHPPFKDAMYALPLAQQRYAKDNIINQVSTTRRRGAIVEAYCAGLLNKRFRALQDDEAYLHFKEPETKEYGNNDVKLITVETGTNVIFSNGSKSREMDALAFFHHIPILFDFKSGSKYPLTEEEIERTDHLARLYFGRPAYIIEVHVTNKSSFEAIDKRRYRLRMDAQYRIAAEVNRLEQ